MVIEGSILHKLMVVRADITFTLVIHSVIRQRIHTLYGLTRDHLFIKFAYQKPFSVLVSCLELAAEFELGGGFPVERDVRGFEGEGLEGLGVVVMVDLHFGVLRFKGLLVECSFC